MTRPVPDGWTIYHASEAGAPDLHGVAAGEAGDWHYQPDDYADGYVWSAGYLTWADALRALLAEVAYLDALDSMVGITRNKHDVKRDSETP